MTWRVLVVDDESDVLDVLELALSDVVVAGRPLEIERASSAREATERLERHDYDMVVVDIIMETDLAGFELISWIAGRTDRARPAIIVHSGQPGVMASADDEARGLVDRYVPKGIGTLDDLLDAIEACLAPRANP